MHLGIYHLFLQDPPDFALNSTHRPIPKILRDQSTMSAKGGKEVELSSDIDFIKTPAAKPAEFETGKDCGIALTSVSLCH